MKTKLALILGIICMAVSALTLFSVLGHAQTGGASTFTFINVGPSDDINATFKEVTATDVDVSLLKSDRTLLKLDISPVKLPKAVISSVFIKFSSPNEATMAASWLMNNKTNLVTSYLVSYTANRGNRPITLMNGAPLLDSGAVFSSKEFSRDNSLDKIIEKVIRDRELTQGIYGRDGWWRKQLDSLTCQGIYKANCDKISETKYPPRP